MHVTLVLVCFRKEFINAQRLILYQLTSATVRCGCVFNTPLKSAYQRYWLDPQYRVAPRLLRSPHTPLLNHSCVNPKFSSPDGIAVLVCGFNTLRFKILLV